MAAIEVDITAGSVRTLAVLPTSTDLTLLTSDGYLYGWSLRDVSGDLPAYVQGSVTSPAAGATIATITGLAAGEYVVEVVTELGGTLAAADANNFQLVPSSGPAINLQNQAVAGNYPQEEVTVTVGASGSVTVKAIALATVGAVYSAEISLTPVGNVGFTVELQDGNEPLGESQAGAGGVDHQWFGGTGVRIKNQVKLHLVQGAVTGTVYCGWSDYPS